MKKINPPHNKAGRRKNVPNPGNGRLRQNKGRGRIGNGHLAGNGRLGG
ncbi:MAG: hypothetical protein R3E31_28185 [Chloroflexota bacterium]